MHDVFSDPYRCGVLYNLQENDEPVPIDAVVEEILASSPDDLDRDTVEERRAWLVNEHILKLDEFGLIDCDRDRGTLRLSRDVSVTVAHPWPVD